MAQRARTKVSETIPAKSEEHTITSLVGDLRDGDRETRLAAARELSRLGYEEGRDISGAYEELSRHLLDADSDIRLRMACAQALGCIPTSDSIRTLQGVLEHMSDSGYGAVSLGSEIAQSLTHIYHMDVSKSPEVLAALARGLSNEDLRVVRDSASALAHLAAGELRVNRAGELIETETPLDISEAYVPLKMLLLDKESTESVREQCANALAYIATDDSIMALRAAFVREPEDSSARIAIVNAIRRLAETLGYPPYYETQ